MIQHIQIRNYALIEHLEMDFTTGFITITGETGAGKSILMGALSLVLGNRADTSVLKWKDNKCIVEGHFQTGERYRSFFDTHDLDYDPVTIIRREILPGGKSRAFINDTPVTLGVLKTLGDQLVDIHSQHQSLQLKDHTYQLEVVDYVGENREELERYQEAFARYREKNRELEQLTGELESLKGELDFYQFQYDELKAANLKEGELEEMEEELETLEHAEEIREVLMETARMLNDETGAVPQVKHSLERQRKVSEYYPPLRTLLPRMESVHIELKDIAAEVENLASTMEDDPARLQEVQERVDLLHSLLQKHKAKYTGELIELREQLEEKISRITFSDETLAGLREEISSMESQLRKQAGKMHGVREKTGKYIEKEVISLLRELGIPHALFQVGVKKTAALGPNGVTDVRFLFSANKQLAPEEVSRVASGGEVSRLMLSIKSLLSDYKGLPTLIFDEIDAGVSGEVAEKVGAIMQRMSGGRQVIAITHLPQVASQGTEHYLVYKYDTDHTTQTDIRKLTPEERVTEIAKLLSGKQVTDAALTNARALLKG